MHRQSMRILYAPRCMTLPVLTLFSQRPMKPTSLASEASTPLSELISLATRLSRLLLSTALSWSILVGFLPLSFTISLRCNGNLYLYSSLLISSGYGFLSENAEFARNVEKAGLIVSLQPASDTLLQPLWPIFSLSLDAQLTLMPIIVCRSHTRGH